jgi:hypothetical protein
MKISASKQQHRSAKLISAMATAWHHGRQRSGGAYWRENVASGNQISRNPYGLISCHASAMSAASAGVMSGWLIIGGSAAMPVPVCYNGV